MKSVTSVQMVYCSKQNVVLSNIPDIYKTRLHVFDCILQYCLDGGGGNFSD